MYEKLAGIWERAKIKEIVLQKKLLGGACIVTVRKKTAMLGSAHILPALESCTLYLLQVFSFIFEVNKERC